MKNKKAALVLSGGGALGVSHIGALKYLEEKDYQFDFYAGVSAGAIISSLKACEKSADEMEKILKELKLFSLAFDFSSKNFGLLRGDKVKKMLDELYEDKNIEDLEYKLYIGATDFQTGERVIISKGKISDAVRASLSVPILFDPFYHEGEKRWLVDGGLSQNFPLDIAIEKYKHDKIIAVDVSSNLASNIDFAVKKRFRKILSLRRTMERTFRIFFKNQQNHFKDDKRVLKIIPDLTKFTSLDVFKLDDMVEKGYEAAKSCDL